MKTGHTFLTPARPTEAEILVRKSRFRAFLYPVASRTAARVQVADLRQRFPDARHHCWACLIGDPAGTATAAMDDDGEPSGTAGRPILNVLQHRNVGHALIVVVRWFGGIKLGAGGLIRAYGQAARAVLDTAELIPYRPSCRLQLQLDYAAEARLRQLLPQYEGQLLTLDYGDTLQATVALPCARQPAFAAALKRLGLPDPIPLPPA